MRLYCGTSGFSFPAWKGPFYPKDLPAADMLGYYASRLPAVEINNTFYRVPKRDVIAGWHDRVPEDFRFAVKASRRISHNKRLADCAEPAGYFFSAIDGLGERLGCVLVQLPPTLRVDVARLEAFLELVPAGVAVAFEFRHASWRDEAVLAALARRDAAWVTADEDGGPPPELPRTASWTYLRLRAPAYPAARLREWRARCADFERAFVFFKHEDDGLGPKLAETMQSL